MTATRAPGAVLAAGAARVLAGVRRVARRLPGRARARLGRGLVVVAASACTDPDAVRVELQAYRPATLESRRLELRAQVAGPLDGLQYRWYAVAGEHAPQQSTTPVSHFTFADGTTRDRVTVEVWRDDRRVARQELDVQFDDSELVLSARPPAVEITITSVPPYDAGGPDTRADIAGTVTGRVDSTLRVVIYARADVWWIQPLPEARHEIGPDGRWSSWTHTGTSYAALVVRAGFVPLQRYDVLPQVGGNVLARTVVDGVQARP